MTNYAAPVAYRYRVTGDPQEHTAHVPHQGNTRRVMIEQVIANRLGLLRADVTVTGLAPVWCDECDADVSGTLPHRPGCTAA